MAMTFEPATADRFDDIAQLLAPRQPDAPACWCLTYRVTSGEFNALRGADRPNRLRGLCERTPSPGLIAYVDGVPAGWCAFGPRTEMGRLQRSRTIPLVDDRPVWSVVCFVVRPGYRRRGLAHRMLDAAVAYATSQHVQMLEGYPVEPDGTRISAAFAYVGTTSLFAAAGFTKVMPTTSRSGGHTRWVMRRELSSDG
jgi:GNAT superfamily N-acetyltransferase